MSLLLPYVATKATLHPEIDRKNCSKDYCEQKETQIVFSRFTNVLGLLLSMFGLWASDQQVSDFVGFAYQGKDFVFRFIIEYSSLKDLGP
jgi:hypothetical protein